jgi:ankyrin repeat protein
VCELWKRPLKLGKYLDGIFSKNTEILTYFIKRFGISSIKGLERIICRKATVSHYHVIMDKQICMSLLEALRFTLTYGKQKEFLFLMRHIRCGEQLNAIFTTEGHSTINLLAIASVTGNYVACEKLLKAGADPTVLINNSKYETMTTLHTICNNKYKERDLKVTLKIIRLLKLNMDPKSKNAEGIMALDFAKERSNTEICNLLTFP